jgi:hypothetical protein
MNLFGGTWRISRRFVQLNEGGYVCGLSWSWQKGWFDAWFKLPIRSARSVRATRWPGGEWRFGRGAT